jgi:hypothetical protein
MLSGLFRFQQGNPKIMRFEANPAGLHPFATAFLRIRHSESPHHLPFDRNCFFYPLSVVRSF